MAVFSSGYDRRGERPSLDTTVTRGRFSTQVNPE
jgi:hypothetical protein